MCINFHCDVLYACKMCVRALEDECVFCYLLLEVSYKMGKNECTEKKAQLYFVFCYKDIIRRL